MWDIVNNIKQGRQAKQNNSDNHEGNADQDQLARCLTEKLLAYATGAAPTKADKTEVEAIVRKLREQNYGFKSLIHEVVQSPVFQSK